MYAAAMEINNILNSNKTELVDIKKKILMIRNSLGGGGVFNYQIAQTC